MYEVYFENAINYSGSNIKYADNRRTINLSTLTYVHQDRRPFFLSFANDIFDLGSILNPDKLVACYQLEGDYHIIVQKDVAELGKAFNIDLSEYVSHIKKDIDNKMCEYRGRVLSLIIAVNYFAENRLNFITCQHAHQILPSFLKDKHDDILNIFSLIQKTIGEIELDINDYHFVSNKYLFTRKGEFINNLYNYKEIRKLFRKLSTSENEYYDYHYRKDDIKTMLYFHKAEYKNTKNAAIFTKISALEEEQKEIDEILDKINENPAFNRELISMFSMVLEDLIDQENAIDEFVKKVLTNTLSITKILTPEGIKKSLEDKFENEIIKEEIKKLKKKEIDNQIKMKELLNNIDKLKNNYNNIYNNINNKYKITK